MSTYTQITYQIIFSTRNRVRALTQPGRKELLEHIAGILRNKKCHIYAVNGVEDHIHICCYLHPSVSLSSLVKDIKLSTSEMIKRKRLFPHFGFWQEGYSAFTYSIDSRPNVINYILNQENHHKSTSSVRELLNELGEHGIEYDPEYFK